MTAQRQRCSIHNSPSSAFMYYSRSVRLLGWFIFSFALNILFSFTLSSPPKRSPGRISLPGENQARGKGCLSAMGTDPLPTQTLSNKQPESTVMLHTAAPGPAPHDLQPTAREHTAAQGGSWTPRGLHPRWCQTRAAASWKSRGCERCGDVGLNPQLATGSESLCPPRNG